jgi:uncharacterized membrane protein
MPFCSQCGADITGVSFCSKCGAAVAAEEGGAAESTPASTSGGQSGGAAAAAQPAAQPSSQGEAASSDNVMGALAYVTPIPAIIFLLIDPYKNIPFVRFHSFQSLFFCVAAIAIGITMAILSIILSMVGIGFLVGLLSFVMNIGFFVLWIVLLIKAFQGQQFKLPVIGDLAQKQV